MTKARPALSFAQAVTRIAGLIGHGPAADIGRCSVRTIYNWCDPDSTALPDLDTALALDAAYVAAGGDCAPLHDCYALQLGCVISDAIACRQALATDVAAAVHECGEALSASIAVIQPGAGNVHIHRAIAESEQAYGAMGRMVHRLKSFLEGGRGAGSGVERGEPK